MAAAELRGLLLNILETKPYTHQQLADLARVSRPTVTRFIAGHNLDAMSYTNVYRIWQAILTRFRDLHVFLDDPVTKLMTPAADLAWVDARWTLRQVASILDAPHERDGLIKQGLWRTWMVLTTEQILHDAREENLAPETLVREYVTRFGRAGAVPIVQSHLTVGQALEAIGDPLKVEVKGRLTVLSPRYPGAFVARRRRVVGFLSRRNLLSRIVRQVRAEERPAFRPRPRRIQS